MKGKANFNFNNENFNADQVLTKRLKRARQYDSQKSGLVQATSDILTTKIDQIKQLDILPHVHFNKKLQRYKDEEDHKHRS